MTYEGAKMVLEEFIRAEPTQKTTSSDPGGNTFTAYPAKILIVTGNQSDRYTIDLSILTKFTLIRSSNLLKVSAIFANSDNKETDVFFDIASIKILRIEYRSVRPTHIMATLQEDDSVRW